VLTFFGLETTADRNRWRMPVIPRIASGSGALYGGCGLGACIKVAEQVTGRRLLWATAQYLSYARPPAVLDLEVREVVRGHQTSQVRVIAHVGDEEILTVLGALGDRPTPFTGQWAVRPTVPPPDECPPRPRFPRHSGTMMSRFEMRLADARPSDDFPGSPGNGRSALWVRLPEVPDMEASALAIIGDLVPFGIGQALGRRAGGNSLDNTLRVAHRAPTRWVLADVHVHAIADGYGHGFVHLWADDGTLLGTASQSAIVRAWKDEPPPKQEVPG